MGKARGRGSNGGQLVAQVHGREDREDVRLLMSLVGASLIRPSATSRTCVGRPYSLQHTIKGDEVGSSSRVSGRGRANVQVEDAALARVSDPRAGVADLL